MLVFSCIVVLGSAIGTLVRDSKCCSRRTDVAKLISMFRSIGLMFYSDRLLLDRDKVWLPRPGVTVHDTSSVLVHGDVTEVLRGLC